MNAWSIPAVVTAREIAILLGLSLFFGLAFEEFYAAELPNRPGGIRTFPLLSLAGAGLYAIEPHAALAFVAGLIALGAWLYGYVRASLHVTGGRVEGHLVVPTANLLAYTLGGLVLTQPLWFPVAIAVISVLLLGSRKRLHALAARLAPEEILTAGRFVLLVGVVLPLLYGLPAIPFTTITPFKVWLAVVAVSTLSYVSYIVQRYVFTQRGALLTALLGGLYSSTATTVVLARKAHDEGVTADISAGIVAATGMMYIRMLLVVAAFNIALAHALLVPIVVLALLAIAAAFIINRTASASRRDASEPSNPLQITTALIFAVLLIVISIVSTWVQQHLGRTGVLALAAVVGITDIDPFVLSIAQSGVATVGLTIGAAAILIASTSNNVLKAVYTLVFSRRRESWLPASVLFGVAVLGAAAAWMVAR